MSDVARREGAQGATFHLGSCIARLTPRQGHLIARVERSPSFPRDGGRPEGLALARVVAVGANVSLEVLVGDKIFFGEYAGKRLEIEPETPGGVLRVVPAEEVMAVLAEVRG